MITKINSGHYSVSLDGKRIKLYTGVSGGYNEDNSMTLYFTPDEWDEMFDRGEIVKAQIDLASKLERELETKKLRKNKYKSGGTSDSIK